MLAVRRRFEFERDTFAFPNELVWEYHFDEATGTTGAARRVPAPDYVHRCFVLVRAARGSSTTTPASRRPLDARTTTPTTGSSARSWPGARAGRPARATRSRSPASRDCAS
jgi:hypothetical protein